MDLNQLIDDLPVHHRRLDHGEWETRATPGLRHHEATSYLDKGGWHGYGPTFAESLAAFRRRALLHLHIGIRFGYVAGYEIEGHGTGVSRSENRAQ